MSERTVVCQFFGLFVGVFRRDCLSQFAALAGRSFSCSFSWSSLILSFVRSSCLPSTVILVPRSSFLSFSSASSVCLSDLTSKLPTLLYTGVWSVALSSSETALSVSETSISNCCFWLKTACKVCCNCCSLANCSCSWGGSSTSSLRILHRGLRSYARQLRTIKGCDNIHRFQRHCNKPQERIGSGSQSNYIPRVYHQF